MTRSKYEAEMRLAMGVARYAMRDGLTPEEAVQAIKKHRKVVQSLDRPQAHDEDVATTTQKRCVAE